MKSTFAEDLHPRSVDGTFAEKPLTPAEVTLGSAGSADVTEGEVVDAGVRVASGCRRAADLTAGHEVRLFDLVEGIADENTREWWHWRASRERVARVASITSHGGVTELTLTGSLGTGTLTMPDGFVVELDMGAACQECEEPLDDDDRDGVCASCSEEL